MNEWVNERAIDQRTTSAAENGSGTSISRTLQIEAHSLHLGKWVTKVYPAARV